MNFRTESQLQGELSCYLFVTQWFISSSFSDAISTTGAIYVVDVDSKITKDNNLRILKNAMVDYSKAQHRHLPEKLTKTMTVIDQDIRQSNQNSTAE